MNKPIQRGDIVWLKSGGSAMTVVRVNPSVNKDVADEPSVVDCFYIGVLGEPQAVSIAEDLLVSISSKTRDEVRFTQITGNVTNGLFGLTVTGQVYQWMPDTENPGVYAGMEGTSAWRPVPMTKLPK